MIDENNRQRCLTPNGLITTSGPRQKAVRKPITCFFHKRPHFQRLSRMMGDNQRFGIHPKVVYTHHALFKLLIESTRVIPFVGCYASLVALALPHNLQCLPNAEAQTLPAVYAFKSEENNELLVSFGNGAPHFSFFGLDTVVRTKLGIAKYNKTRRRLDYHQGPVIVRYLLPTFVHVQPTTKYALLFQSQCRHQLPRTIRNSEDSAATCFSSSSASELEAPCTCVLPSKIEKDNWRIW